MYDSAGLCGALYKLFWENLRTQLSFTDLRKELRYLLQITQRPHLAQLEDDFPSFKGISMISTGDLPKRGDGVLQLQYHTVCSFIIFIIISTTMARGYSRPYCKACNVKRKSSLVLFSLINGWLGSVVEGWKGNGANICDECVTRKRNEDATRKIFGCLNPGPASIDFFNASKEGSHADTFACDGVVVTPSSECPCSQPFVDEMKSIITNRNLNCRAKSGISVMYTMKENPIQRREGKILMEIVAG